MLSMADEDVFAMALRTGNWGRAVMLPFHKPLHVTLAPEDAPNTLVHLDPGVVPVPDDLTAAEVHSLTVTDGEGRIALKVDGRADRVERNRVDLEPHHWQMTLEGTPGLLTLYAREATAFPPDEVLDRLSSRLGYPLG